MNYVLVKRKVGKRQPMLLFLVTITMMVYSPSPATGKNDLGSEELVRDQVWVQFAVLPQGLHVTGLDGNILAHNCR